MANTYTPFDPHEYELRSAIVSTQRNSHVVNITSTMVELIIFEHELHFSDIPYEKYKDNFIHHKANIK